MLHFLHFNVFVLLVWLSKVEKGKGEKLFFCYHTNPQKLDWKQSSRKGKTIRHKLETTKHLAVAEVLIHLHT